MMSKKVTNKKVASIVLNEKKTGKGSNSSGGNPVAPKEIKKGRTSNTGPRKK